MVKYVHIPIPRINVAPQCKENHRKAFFAWGEKGLLSWEVCDKEHKQSIQQSFGILRKALARYKDRRIRRAGYFYFCKHHRSLHLVFVMSPLLHTMPRKERSVEGDKSDSEAMRSLWIYITLDILLYNYGCSISLG
jgi:hypothetical protein